ncbi:hypothetical protein PH210_11585 [Paenibacillus sp. BSR1-1]|uniref:hypothetical protein n=1 Tax=Paenibacillus sp. BSR1-1 TaxID=3020845 RepID=UPI0025B10A3E|nr:hypothetical protein [Paenibacillus sp. BSR1-1]MDN3016838.1 hypothetical protein [Paenibacillus sp. BSR1-1]
MEEKNQYREDLLEGCNNIYSYWNSMRPRFSKLVDIIILEEWEGYCRQLKEKLLADLKEEVGNHQSAERLYQQWEQLFKESNAYQEEIKDNSEKRLELEEQKQFHEEELWDIEGIQEEIVDESDTEEQKQYREELLKWCNNIYSNWESMRPRFSTLFDIKSLEEWEESYRQLNEKLHAEIKVDFDDYQTAERLYEQWELLYKELNAYQEKREIEVESVQHLELEEQKLIHEDFLETEALQEENKVELDKWLDTEEQQQYHEYLLEWCNNMFSNWESMRPRFAKLIDMKSLEEWEESCRHLKEKLQADSKVDFDDYQTAERLHEQWDQLYKGSYTYKAML